MAVRKKSKPGAAGRDIKASRRAAGVNVIISIAAATALLIVVNVIANMVGSRHNLRWHVETLGRYRLSETAKRVLDQVNQPVRLTSIYTSAKQDRKPEQYLPRLRDLLEEMRQWKGDVTVLNVAGDRGKADVVARLRQRLDKAAEEHRKLIERFQILAQTQEALYQQEVQKWRAYPPGGWLGRFGLPKAFETYLDSSGEVLKELAALIRQELTGAALPDYPGLAGQIKDTLEKVSGVLEKIGENLRALAALPVKAQQARKELTEAAKTVAAELHKAVEAAGKSGSAAPADPGKVLEKVAAAARAASEASDKATRRLVQLDADAGSQLQNLPSWRTAAISLSQLRDEVGSLAAQVQQVNVAVKAELQKQVITEQLRPGLPGLLTKAQSAEAAVAQMLGELTKLDEPTAKAFEEAKRDDFLQAQLKPIKELLRQAGELGELAHQTELIEQIAEDNIVLVEVGEKVGVVPFEDVWPLAPRSGFDSAVGDEQPERRIFYGDTAICAKLLNVTSQPFAEVVLTFFEDIPPPYMGRRARAPISGPIPSMYLQTLRQRLQKANVEVKEWNLAKEDSPPAADDGRKQVLLVLPPPDFQPPMMGPQQVPRFGPEHVQKVRKVIADGAPAIFLAGYLRPRFWGQTTPPEYGWADYLKEDWALDVKTALRIVLGERDPLEPDKFVMPILRWDFLPLSTFVEDSPIGKPLRARRFYWLSACPIAKVAPGRDDVTVDEILTLPADMDNMWAAADAEQLWQRIISGRGTGIVPNPDGGDMLPPLSLAVEARKTINEKEVRTIVLGVGLSYIDGFLTYRVPQLKGESLATESPPTGNVDLVVNSVYHLAGRGEFIGAGPAIVQPIKLIRRRTMTLVKIVFGLIWPALVVAAGGAVMLARRR